MSQNKIIVALDNDKFNETIDIVKELKSQTFAFKIGSTALGVRWRLGSPRIHLRQDGRR